MKLRNKIDGMILGRNNT